MDLTRNHYFITGILLFLIGVQFRYVTSFELNDKTTQFIDKRLGRPVTVENQTFGLFSAAPVSSGRVVRPPRWLGFSMLSVGSVLILFSLTMKKPGT